MRIIAVSVDRRKGNGRFDGSAVVRRQGNVERAQRLGEPVTAPGTDQPRPAALPEPDGQRRLGDCGT